MEVVNLTDKLRARLAYDDDAATVESKSRRQGSSLEEVEFFWVYPEHLALARWENARLKPIHEALIRVVEAADTAANRCCDHETIHPVARAIEKLEELLK